MDIQAKYVENRTFLARGDSNHWVPVDTSGGTDAASTPMEMVLFGLATCSGLDVVSILEKRRVQLDDMEIHANAERADEHPRVYTKIHLKYSFTSPDLTEKDADRAISLSQDKYCSVSKMLESTADITYEFEIKRTPVPVE